MKKRISTVQLGQFTWEHANEIAGVLEKAGIVWWYKQPGYFSSIWEKGIRLFVDNSRLEEAQTIAREVLLADSHELSGDDGPLDSSDGEASRER